MKVRVLFGLLGVTCLTIGGLLAAPGPGVVSDEFAVVTQEELGRLLFWDPIL